MENKEKKMVENILLLYTYSQLMIEVLDELKGTDFYRQSTKNLINKFEKELESICERFWYNIKLNGDDPDAVEAQKAAFETQKVWIENVSKIINATSEQQRVVGKAMDDPLWAKAVCAAYGGLKEYMIELG